MNKSTKCLRKSQPLNNTQTVYSHTPIASCGKTSRDSLSTVVWSTIISPKETAKQITVPFTTGDSPVCFNCCEGRCHWDEEKAIGESAGSFYRRVYLSDFKALHLVVSAADSSITISPPPLPLARILSCPSDYHSHNVLSPYPREKRVRRLPMKSSRS